jgi:hypothetical protein
VVPETDGVKLMKGFTIQLGRKGTDMEQMSMREHHPMCIFFHVMLALYVSNVSYFLGVNVAIAPQ